jgi:ABC-type sugar transport system substrate-binding protein
MTDTWKPIVTAVAAVCLLAACSSGGTSSDPSSEAPPAGAAATSEAPAAEAPAATFKVGFATGGEPDADWQVAQGDVARALAEARGWDYLELSNAANEQTATKNADLFIQAGVDIVMMFNGTPSVNPVLAKKYAEAGIPVVTFDIAQEGFYFVGIDNAAAGTAGGTALGELAKEKWDCAVDLVLSSEAADAGQANTWRAGNAVEAVKQVCPDIPTDSYITIESGGTVAGGLAAAPGVLAAHPNAERILVVGLNDNGVTGVLQAATQLGRDGSIMGWGQDGSGITSPNADPNLVGSVLYFLESYPVQAFEIADAIAAGNPPAMKDTATDPAILAQPCPVTKEEAVAIPSMAERITLLADAPQGTTAYELFCPAAN